MTVRDFLGALSAGGRADVPAAKLSVFSTTTSEQALLGAILLDDAGLCCDDLRQGTTILLHDDQDVCDCIYEAVAGVLRDDVRLLMHGTWFDAYDDAVNDGTPVVIVTFDRAIVLPQDALLLADRVIDLGDVGRPAVVAALTKAITGTVFHLTTREAASFEAESLMRCVRLASSGQDVACRLAAWLEEARTRDPTADATAAPRVPRRTDLRA